jgi:hypothetical protein
LVKSLIPKRKRVIVGISVLTIGINAKSQMPITPSRIEDNHCHFVSFFPNHIAYERAAKQRELTIKAAMYGSSPISFSGA